MGPLIPRPAVTAIALILTAALVYNMNLDASSASYDGANNTYILAGLIAGILGFGLSRRGRK